MRKIKKGDELMVQMRVEGVVEGTRGTQYLCKGASEDFVMTTPVRQADVSENISEYNEEREAVNKGVNDGL